MEENKEFNPKILRKEIFTVKRPQRIAAGDLQRLVPLERH